MEQGVFLLPQHDPQTHTENILKSSSCLPCPTCELWAAHRSCRLADTMPTAAGRGQATKDLFAVRFQRELQFGQLEQ